MGSRVLVNIGAQRFDRNTGLHSGGRSVWSVHRGISGKTGEARLNMGGYR